MKRKAHKRPVLERLHLVTLLTDALQAQSYCQTPRAAEYTALLELLQRPVRREVIFVSGNPGCGKTATLRAVLSALSEATRPAFANAAQLPRPGFLYRQLARQLSGVRAASRTTEKLSRVALCGRAVVIDEADYLSPRLLYDVLELDARVVLVANSLGFLQEDPRLASRAQDVRRVVFCDYAPAELVEIAQNKLAHAVPDGNAKTAGNAQLQEMRETLAEVIPEPVLRFAAQRVIQKGGDLREYLDALPRIVAAADGTPDLEAASRVLGTQTPPQTLFSVQEIRCLRAASTAPEGTDVAALRSAVGDPVQAAAAVRSLVAQGLLKSIENRYISQLDSRSLHQLCD